MPKDEETRGLYELERSATPSGKHKVSEERRRRVLRGFKKALAERDQAAFEEAILELGLQPGSPEYARALSLWRTWLRRGG